MCASWCFERLSNSSTSTQRPTDPYFLKNAWCLLENTHVKNTLTSGESEATLLIPNHHGRLITAGEKQRQKRFPLIRDTHKNTHLRHISHEAHTWIFHILEKSLQRLSLALTELTELTFERFLTHTHTHFLYLCCHCRLVIPWLGVDVPLLSISARRRAVLNHLSFSRPSFPPLCLNCPWNLAFKELVGYKVFFKEDLWFYNDTGRAFPPLSPPFHHAAIGHHPHQYSVEINLQTFNTLLSSNAFYSRRTTLTRLCISGNAVEYDHPVHLNPWNLILKLWDSESGAAPRRRSDWNRTRAYLRRHVQKPYHVQIPSAPHSRHRQPFETKFWKSEIKIV